MSDQFLNFYNAELSYLRKSGDHFSRIHPKTAGHLRMDRQGADDPLVSRILESFAFLTAKCQSQISQDFESLAHSMLSLLLPNALLPTPSMTMVQFMPEVGLDEVKKVSSGTLLETTALVSDLCRFTTAFDVDVAPLSIKTSRLFPISDLPDSLEAPRCARAFFKIQIQSFTGEFSQDTLPEKKIRLMLNAHKQYANSLYGYLMNYQAGALMVWEGDKEGLSFYPVPEAMFKEVGFAYNDLLLPAKKYPFKPFQVFSEFCYFPSKYRFFDVTHFSELAVNVPGKTCEYYVFLSEYKEKYTQRFQSDLFQLGCTPVVNIFPSQSKPLHLTAHQIDYPLESGEDMSKAGLEIYDVSSVLGWQSTGTRVPFQKNHGETYSTSTNKSKFYWETVRKEMWEFGELDLNGQEVLLRINASSKEDIGSWYATANLICTNRDRASRTNLCQQGGEFKLYNEKMKGYTIDCLYHPTPSHRKIVNKNQLFIFISTLVASHDQYFIPNGQPYDAQVLRQHLRSLNTINNPEVDILINQIKTITCQRITRRYPKDANITFVNGLKVSLDVEVAKEDQEEMYLFASVVRHLFHFYCPINSVMEFSIINRMSGESYQWPAQFH